MRNHGKRPDQWRERILSMWLEVFSAYQSLKKKKSFKAFWKVFKLLIDLLLMLLKFRHYL